MSYKFLCKVLTESDRAKICCDVNPWSDWWCRYPPWLLEHAQWHTAFDSIEWRRRRAQVMNAHTTERRERERRQWFLTGLPDLRRVEKITLPRCFIGLPAGPTVLLLPTNRLIEIGMSTRTAATWNERSHLCKLSFFRSVINWKGLASFIQGKEPTRRKTRRGRVKLQFFYNPKIGKWPSASETASCGASVHCIVVVTSPPSVPPSLRLRSRVAALTDFQSEFPTCHRRRHWFLRSFTDARSGLMSKLERRRWRKGKTNHYNH